MSGRNKRKSETPTEAYCRDPEAYMRQLMAAADHHDSGQRHSGRRGKPR